MTAAATGGPKITVTNPDIRAIQMAKAALYSGARLLMDKFGVDKVDRVVLAGAFGAHISPKHAMVLGMIPDVPFERVTSAGNAAGSGARIALIDTSQRAAIEETVRQIEKIETAIEPKFQEHFVNASAIPNSGDPFTLLKATVPLPRCKFQHWWWRWSWLVGDDEGDRLLAIDLMSVFLVVTANVVYQLRHQAGMVKRYHASFPSLSYGFNSRYPLQSLPK